MEAFGAEPGLFGSSGDEKRARETWAGHEDEGTYSIVYSHTDMLQGIFLCTLNLLLCHSSVIGICCPGQYMKKQSSMAIYMLSIKSETA